MWSLAWTARVRRCVAHDVIAVSLAMLDASRRGRRRARRAAHGHVVDRPPPRYQGPVAHPAGRQGGDRTGHESLTHATAPAGALDSPMWETSKGPRARARTLLCGVSFVLHGHRGAGERNGQRAEGASAFEGAFGADHQWHRSRFRPRLSTQSRRNPIRPSQASSRTTLAPFSRACSDFTAPPVGASLLACRSPGRSDIIATCARSSASPRGLGARHRPSGGRIVRNGRRLDLLRLAAQGRS